MSESGGIISMLINFGIIFFVIKIIMKAVKKSKGQNQESNPVNKNKDGSKEVIINMQPKVKNLKYEATTANVSELNLKRCPNCGGEIPITMMRCSLCGHRQAGCSIVVVLLVLGFIALAVYLMSASSGMDIGEIIRYLTGLLIKT